MRQRGFIPPFRPIEARNTYVLLPCIIYPQHPSLSFSPCLCVCSRYHLLAQCSDSFARMQFCAGLIYCSCCFLVGSFVQRAVGSSSQTSAASLYCQTPFALFLQARHGQKPTFTSTAKCLVYYFSFFMTGEHFATTFQVFSRRNLRAGR